MARDRARSSFTVEVRRGRSAEPLDARRSLWRGVDLAAEALRHEPRPIWRQDARPDPLPLRAPPREASPETPRGRILPSLLAEPVADATSVIEASSETTPRPRAVRARRHPVVRPVEFEVAVAIPPEPVVAKTPSSWPVAEAPRPIGIRLRSRPARGERVLRAGERWKRRLPRACW